MKSLKLFNGVLKKDIENTEPYFDVLGFVIEPSAMWAKGQIVRYYEENTLSAQDLNKTFHKSWDKIKNSTRFELLVEQILHYTTTYGTDFKSDFIYIPTEKLDIPRVDINKLKFKVIRGYTRQELINKSLSLLSSGIALKEETIDDVLSLLIDELEYDFDGGENIRNKEAIIKLADLYGIYPHDPEEFFRYIYYKTTGETLLIKNDYAISLIKRSSYNPTVAFKKYGLKKLATIFNRFKPLFLAYKNRSRKTINKISKLSKKYHKPLVVNPLNEVTSKLLKDEDLHWLDNATTFNLFKVLNACFTRLSGQENFMYNIRNGKSWVETRKSEKYDLFVYNHNFNMIMRYLKNKYDFSDTVFYVPEHIDYALPTSEKMFVGNIPHGTKIYGDNLIVGFYWENEWGARDLDLSANSLKHKIGWNSYYNEGGLLYSGDITTAPDGAVEYLHVSEGTEDSYLVNMNVYSGKNDSEYKIIVGDSDETSQDYMMNPNNRIFEVMAQAVSKEMILGMITQEYDTNVFILMNRGLGDFRVSSSDKRISKIANKAIEEEYKNKIALNELLSGLGAKITSDENENFDVNLSPDELDRDTIMNIFG